MTRDTVIVFARVPRIGTVKRRLARDIGDRAALRFYQGNLARLLRSLVRDRRFSTVLAATPGHVRVRWPVRVPIMAQGGGDLGHRMHRACAAYRRVAIVGTDIPALGADDVAAAFRALGRAQAAFGPSDDGGYWLVALSPPRPARPVATSHALADTLANFAGRRVALLRTLRDVDTGTDLTAATDADLTAATPAAGRRGGVLARTGAA